MKVERLTEIIGADFFTGVPDSQLKALCDYLFEKYKTDPRHHIIGVNEGNCAAIAAGYHLATGKVPVVYMQNSGQGNMINPMASLLSDMVYGIPCIFIIGWRGEPGVHDEPQHVYQGEVTLKLLEVMDIEAYVIGKDTTEDMAAQKMADFQKLLAKGKCAAFVIRKGALQYDKKAVYKNSHVMKREEIIRHVAEISGEDPLVSTTGKASRELFEIRESRDQGHQYDFLTVGSMGHASSIAMEIALLTPDRKIWCLDGDGAALMHMGAMAVIGSVRPENLIHIVINNEAHETVGGMPTAAGKVDLPAIAKACGYNRAVSVDDFESLDRELKNAKLGSGLTFIEAKCTIGARDDLGRPTTTPRQNKEWFMGHLRDNNREFQG